MAEVAEYWHQVVKINDYQRKRFAQLIISHFGDQIAKKRIALLGWAFKKNTNDSRESPSIYVSEILLTNGAHINIYDPQVPSQQIINDLENKLLANNIKTKEIDKILSRVTIIEDLYDCFNKVDAIAILTEWDIFKDLNWKKIKKISRKPPYIFDGRLIVSKNKLPKEFNLITI